MEFSEFFSEDGPGLGLENLLDQGGDEGEEPPSSDEESFASSELHSGNENVGYSVEEYKRERERERERERKDLEEGGGRSSDESEDEDEEGGTLPELLDDRGRRGRGVGANTPSSGAAAATPHGDTTAYRTPAIFFAVLPWNFFVLVAQRTQKYAYEDWVVEKYGEDREGNLRKSITSSRAPREHPGVAIELITL